MPMLQAGAQAPDFTLPNQNGELVSLSDLRGKRVLIYFYPKAMTPGCTTQACGLRDVQGELAAHNLVVLGISTDSPARLKKFELRDGLNFTLLADEDHAVADAFGVWGPKKFMGKEYDGLHRISFLLDEQGQIAHVFNKFKTSDHHQVVLTHLAG
ncbi:thioredoxin-dependent thiol peroxidase [Aeromonas schubertii]|uniref:thioredoxin-dependent peroxiredoxin n=1 Tax=Aeromonas schubertii TaxID=652 RepID=A0A0S2SP17_9GAMM|nr:thioredoxin-dependent thiol peroxidase [Aeromonas schubertii]ALP43482.1 thiol peroxidase Bcp-type [Aeromonas schubertii]KUE78438.1 bacterioferritin comigratory protein [Aeromonas schubertii]MBZ6072893.1 thioredoxin-dependent thiol peroxidase [Aeromonas schubertii]QCG47058.1 thioredoxin-dependent thiol peroxidase [Aeromonas schubertii]